MGEVDEETRHPLGPDDRPPGGPALGAAVAEQHDIGVEQGEQRVDVAAARGRQQLHQQVRAGRRNLGRSGGADLAAGPAGDLAAVVLRLADGGGDLRERLAEHVGEQEHGPLGGRERVEHDEEAERQRFGDLGGGGRIAVGAVPPARAARDRRSPRGGATRREPVERQPGRHGGQPRGRDFRCRPGRCRTSGARRPAPHPRRRPAIRACGRRGRGGGDARSRTRRSAAERWIRHATRVRPGGAGVAAPRRPGGGAAGERGIGEQAVGSDPVAGDVHAVDPDAVDSGPPGEARSGHRDGATSRSCGRGSAARSRHPP